jgi:hypothetical protein
MDSNHTLVAIVGMLVTFGLPLILVAIVLVYKHQKTRMTHEIIARLADKGQPIPPELFQKRSVHSGLRGGLVLIALGIGLSIFFLSQKDGPWSIGLIPGLIGVALIASWAIERRSAQKTDSQP